MTRITAIVIPADDSQPLRVEEMERNDVDHMQRIVGGIYQVVRMMNPPAWMCMNEEGDSLKLPVNKRASLILGVHKGAFIGQPPIVGDCFILGEPDRRGNDHSAPDLYHQHFFESRSFQVEVRRQGSEEWLRNDLAFIEWQPAYEMATVLGGPRRDIEEVRVVAIGTTHG